MTITHKVEVAFATAPYDPSPTWTDVTGFFAAAGGPTAQITRGRSDQVSQISPSQLTLTLDNHDGRFTAGYTSGAYYPNVVLGKRIRISTNTGSGFVERFDGFVDSWPTQWAPGGRYAEAQITASDRLKKLGRQLAADNLIATYYLPNSPAEYWQLDDADGTVNPHNRAGVTSLAADLGAGGTVTYGDSTGPQYDGLTALLVSGQTLRASASPTYTFSETQSLTLCGFLRCTGTVATTSFVAMFDVWDGLTSPEIALTAGNGTPTASGFVINSVGTLVGPAGVANVMDGNLHFIGMTLKGLGVGSGGTLTVYVDGAVDSTAAVSTAILSGGISAPIEMVAEDPGFGPGSYTWAHLAIFPTALTAQNMADMSAAGLTAFSGETSLARTTRLAGLATVTPIVTGTPGTISMAPLADFTGLDYLSMLQTVADTEAGLLFTQCDGQVRLRPRRDMQNQATKWTLTNGQYGTDLTFVLDDFGVINDAIATRPGGNQQHLTNATSVAANGTYSVSTTLQTTDDNEVLSYAQWEIATSVASTRCSQVTVDMLGQTSLATTYLTIELGDRITLSGLPSTAPASTVDLIVQGWTETIGLDQYSVTMNTSPLPITVWALNDATYSVLGSTTVLAY